MTQLTREYFDERLKTLATKQDVRDAVDELAEMVKNGFDGVDRQLSGIIAMLDVRKDVETLKRQMTEMREALNIKP